MQCCVAMLAAARQCGGFCCGHHCRPFVFVFSAPFFPFVFALLAGFFVLLCLRFSCVVFSFSCLRCGCGSILLPFRFSFGFVLVSLRLSHCFALLSLRSPFVFVLWPLRFSHGFVQFPLQFSRGCIILLFVFPIVVFFCRCVFPVGLSFQFLSLRVFVGFVLLSLRFSGDFFFCVCVLRGIYMPRVIFWTCILVLRRRAPEPQNVCGRSLPNVADFFSFPRGRNEGTG